MWGDSPEAMGRKGRPENPHRANLLILHGRMLASRLQSLSGMTHNERRPLMNRRNVILVPLAVILTLAVMLLAANVGHTVPSDPACKMKATGKRICMVDSYGTTECEPTLVCVR